MASSVSYNVHARRDGGDTRNTIVERQSPSDDALLVRFRARQLSAGRFLG